MSLIKQMINECSEVTEETLVVDVAIESLTDELVAFTDPNFKAMVTDKLMKGNYTGDGLDIAIEQCLDVVTGLEELSEVIGATLSNGGLTVKTSPVVTLALYTTGITIGLDLSDKVPSLEEYTVADGREAATKQIISTIAYGIDKILETIHTLCNKSK